MRVLVTGASGFAGQHLLRHLVDQGDSVFGVVRSAGGAELPSGVAPYSADLRDRLAVQTVVRVVRPEAVYHLAAHSSSRQSLEDPWGTIANNMRAQMTLFDALLAEGLRPRCLVVGSSEEYGAVGPEHLPTAEDAPLRPVTPYAVSKVSQDVLAYQYFAQHSLPTICVRPFTHTGPGHDPRFIVPSFAQQIAEIENGIRPPILHVGNLEAERDFTDVRDIVRGYRLVLRHGTPGEVYNLGWGIAVRIGDLLEELLRMSSMRIRVVVDPDRYRPADVPRQQANITKVQSCTGWHPEIPLQTTLRDTLTFWRRHVGRVPAAA